MSAALFVGTFLSGGGTHRTYSEDLTDHLEARGRRIVRTSRQTSRILRLADMMGTAWLRRSDYEIAHVDVFSGPAFTWAEAVCFELRRMRRPYALTLRGGNLPVFAKRWPRRVGSLLRSAVAVTAPTEYLRSALASCASSISIIPNAIALARYVGRARRVLAPKLVWIRAFHQTYNPVLAVEVLARLGTDATLVMIGADKGDGSLASVRDRAHALGVTSRLTLVPGVPKHEIPSHLDAADVFLNTTNVDNSPVSVLEAMASGLCVVSTNVGGIPFLISDGADGLLVPPGDAGVMTDAVTKLLATPDLAQQVSSGARAHAMQRDWATVLNRWDHLLADVSRHA